MYKEEKIINGVLCYRTDPNGEWREYTIEELTAKYENAKVFNNRARTLLNATYEIGVKQYESCFVETFLESTAFYDCTECDGTCLTNDIADLLELEELG